MGSASSNLTASNLAMCHACSWILIVFLKGPACRWFAATCAIRQADTPSFPPSLLPSINLSQASGRVSTRAGGPPSLSLCSASTSPHAPPKASPDLRRPERANVIVTDCAAGEAKSEGARHRSRLESRADPCAAPHPSRARGRKPLALQWGGLEGGGGLWEKWGFWALEKVAYGGSPRQAREAAAAPVGGVAPLVSLQRFGRWEGGNQTTSFFSELDTHFV